MHVFALLWLGVDSLIAAAAIGPLATGRTRYALACWFGISDGAGFILGTMIGWRLLRRRPAACSRWPVCWRPSAHIASGPERRAYLRAAA